MGMMSVSPTPAVLRVFPPVERAPCGGRELDAEWIRFGGLGWP